MNGFIHATGIIAREKGVSHTNPYIFPITKLTWVQIRGFLQGFVPTTMRQAANSAVRFGSYNTLKQIAQGYVAPGEKLGGVATFGLGAVAGLITVYATQPLDSVKTRMQSIDARGQYRNTFHCAARILKEEGILVFWSGAVPRIGRLMVG